MRRWLAIAMLMLSACGSGEARISFTVPAELASLARSVRVRVVRPTDGDGGFDCDAVAFGEVATERLDGATEREVVIDSGGPTELGELTRSNRTLLIAEAFDAAAALGARVAAGCVERAAIDGGDRVRIAGLPAVELVGLDPSLASGISVPSADVPSPLRLTANDARGLAVAGVVVRMRVIDTSGSTLTIEQTSNSAGAVELATSVLTERAVGAVRLRFFAPWQRAPLSVDTASPPRVASGDIPGTLITAVPVAGTGAIYVAIAEGIDGVVLRRVSVVADAPSIGAATTVPSGFVSLLPVPSGSGEIIVGYWSDATYRVLDASTGTFGAAAPLAAGPLSGSETVGVLPACGDGNSITLIDSEVAGTAMVAVQAQGSVVGLAPLPPFVGTDDVALHAAGCIADDAGGLHRAIAVRADTGAEELRVEGASAPLALPSSSAAMRFGSPADGRFFVAVQTTSGPQVRAYVLGGPASARRLQQVAAIPLGGNPEHLATVDLDGNREVEIVALIREGVPARPAFAVLYQGIDLDPPLSAIFELPVETTDPSPPLALDRVATAVLPFDGDADGRAELWAFRSYVEVAGVIAPGPLPPAPPESHTAVHRVDFGR